MKDRDLLVPRLFAVLAALLFVNAFALGALLPPMLQLDQMIEMANRPALAGLLAFTHAHFPDWANGWIVQPLLARPCWLLPATLGIVCAGISVTMMSRPNATRSRRRS